ncbi:MAG TPA: M20 family metallopeptidase [Nocardioidaceae bacterium]|nr:M20 family metallopeptidase [Nocardioidaceae bacterium]
MPAAATGAASPDDSPTGRAPTGGTPAGDVVPDATLVARFTDALPAMLADIETLIRCESPSSDLAALARSADLVAELGTRLLGESPERLAADGRAHLRWRLGADSAATRVLLLAHHDTVWPVGSLQTHPCDVRDGVLRGPGCFDMKTGIVMALYAAAELAGALPLTVLVTSDEELGSPSSRQLIEQEARSARAALVLESSADGGALKTGRKGTSIYRLAVRGRAAHAGLEPAAGINAAVELAHQVLAISRLGDQELGTTVTPTVLAAGTTTNTVPAYASVAVDVRARTGVEQARVDAAIRALRPTTPGASLDVQGGPNRPPLEEAASEDLFGRAAAIGARLGLRPLAGAAVGGASDGNLTAGVGTPTLDGLGAVGGGAHADHEHVVVAEIPGRTALLAALIGDLCREEEARAAEDGGAPQV